MLVGFRSGLALPMLLFAFVAVSHLANAAGSSDYGKESVVQQESSDAGDGEQEALEQSHRNLSYVPLPTDGIQPWVLVRDLQLLQDMLVNGEAGALEQYRQEVLMVGARMKRADRGVWNIQRNLDAAATFLLIGGDPLVAEVALRSTALKEDDLLPLKAAQAYAGQDLKSAALYFSDFSPKDYPPSMRGQFAFAASVVAGNIDVSKAEALLNMSRRMAAGTLIEETVLRRLIQIAGMKNDARQLGLLVRNYNERFPNSPYFGDFVRVFYQSSLLITKEDFPLIEPQLREVIARLAPDKRLKVVSLIAEKAIGFGRLPLALWAANAGLALVNPDSPLEHQLNLYRAAAMLPNRDTLGEAKELLAAISRDKLDNSHARLLGAVSELAERLDFDFDLQGQKSPVVRTVLAGGEAGGHSGEAADMKIAMVEEVAVFNRPITSRRDMLFKQLNELETVELE